VRDGGGELEEPFDQLVISTGAMPIRPNIPGIDSEGIYVPTTIKEAIELNKALEQGNPRRAVIVGGGYIGIEMAEALLMRGLEVWMIDVLPPNSTLAGNAGIPLGEKGAIRVNNRLQTSADGVWAVGDCVESFHLVSSKPIYVALGTVANKQGRVAGINIGGGDATFPGVVGTAVTKFFETEVARTGLQENEIKQMDLEHVSAKIEDFTSAPYYPGAGRIMVKLHAEKGTGRLLGAQIVGMRGSAKRIDILATALHTSMTVEDIINLDLGYAPPYSQAWDPIHIAARQVLKLV
jgi:NADPH-dependent 2,4-dienoyl-CoA reductase/sulfur reductase-like enzyme